MTPGRRSFAVFDLTETVLLESAFSVTRAGAEIAADIAKGLSSDDPNQPDTRHSGVKLWASGAWTLRPLQEDISNLHEGVVCQPYILNGPQVAASSTSPLLKMTLAAIIAIENQNLSSADLPGMAISSDIQPTGDPWMVKRVPSGASYQTNLVSGTPPPDIVTQDIPMDLVGYSQSVYPPNQAFFLRWTLPGTPQAVYQYTLGFRFGQYAVYIRGTGLAELWERVYLNPALLLPGTPAQDQGPLWRRRATWRYARAGQLSQTAHTMAIWPHVGPRGERYIAFSNGQLEVADLVSNFAKTSAGEVAPGEYVYQIDRQLRNPYDLDGSPGAATAPAICAYDVRRDLRVKAQISLLGWPRAGFLVDLPCGLDPAASSLAAVQGYADTVPTFGQSFTPGTVSITPSLLDAATGGPWVDGSGGQPVARFDFHGDGNGTPILWRYQLNRPPVLGVSAPGAFTVGLQNNGRTGGLRAVSCTGASGDPAQDTASLQISDPTAQWARLRVRGRFSVATVVRVTSGNAVQNVVLQRGYAMRPSAAKRGKAGRPYPAPEWREYDVPCAPRFMRLQEKQLEAVQRSFSYDPTVPYAPGQSGVPYKITDVIRILLEYCGYPPDQINIVDYDQRLWPGTTEKISDDLLLAHGGEIGEFINRLVHDYLGAYLIDDYNAGPTDPNGLPLGQWTLLFQTPFNPDGYFTPLWDFRTAPTAGGRVTPPHLPGAYGPGQGPVFGTPQSQVIPPEFNHVCVETAVAIGSASTQGRVESHCYNPQGYQVPGYPPPDPNNADYIGYERKNVVPDLALGATVSIDQAQANCDWVCRLRYDRSCHAETTLTFTAPLVFVNDPVGGHLRPLRFQDPVAYNGNPIWLVRGCHPHYVKDRCQLATYELVAPVSGQLLRPGMAHLNLFRSADAQGARRASGQAGQGGTAGAMAPAAHKAASFRELPLAQSLFQANVSPQQDPVTGAFMAMADMTAADGAAVR